MISARSPKCIHGTRGGVEHAASNCRTCPTDNAEYQRWCTFWDALPYAWRWDKPKPGAIVVYGHWEIRESGEPVNAEVVLSHLRGMAVTVVGLW
jgi:hypothetical protein